MNTTYRRLREEKGFTLVELLIVIVILGVLSGIVVFAVGAFNNEGVSQACKADAKAVQVAREAFRAKSLTNAYPTEWSDLTGGKYLASQPNGGGEYTVTLEGVGTLASGAAC